MKSKAAYKKLHKAASNSVFGSRIESADPKTPMQMMVMKNRVMTKENS